MPKPKYASAPIPSEKMPGGIPYIIGNEGAERFSFYGMRTILVIFMTKYLVDSDGNLALMSEGEAKVYFHLFVAAVYIVPFLGAMLADVLWGKYRTILSLSVVYCFGHLALALDETRLGLFTGLILISLGGGGIKSCVSAHVGDQFGSRNQHLMAKIFGWFYFAINLGSFASTMLTPILLDKYGPHVAFGVPGALMFLATLVFWMGRWKFVHIPPGGRKFFQETFTAEGLRAVGKLCIVYLFIAMFWCVFDQTGSAWVLQATKMDRRWLGVQWLPSQIQAANPLLILIFIPVFAYGIYPMIDRVFRLTPLRKISIGLFFAVIAASVPIWIEMQIKAGPQMDAIARGFQKLDADGDGRATREEFLTESQQNRQRAENLFARLDDNEDKSLAPSEFENVTSAVPVWVRIWIGDDPQSDDIQEAFDKLDEDGDGKATRSEFLVPWEKNKKDAESLFETLDGDEDGSLQLKEFKYEALEQAYAKLDDAKLDGGGDRLLTSAEFLAVGDTDDAGKLFGRLDEDDDGSVSPREFRIAEMPNIIWQLLGYVMLTIAEVLISITGLEFSYTQAPKKAKSLVMGLFLLAVAGGNLFTAAVNFVSLNPDGTNKLTDVQYYLFFTVMMLLAAVVFIGVAGKYREQTYIQDDAAEASE